MLLSGPLLEDIEFGVGATPVRTLKYNSSAAIRRGTTGGSETWETTPLTLAVRPFLSSSFDAQVWCNALRFVIVSFVPTPLQRSLFSLSRLTAAVDTSSIFTQLYGIPRTSPVVLCLWFSPHFLPHL